MLIAFLVNLVITVHFAFIAFVAVGALLLLRWPRVAWLHVPAALWGALMLLMGWVCPLTPLENRLRAAGGLEAYEGGFMDRYLTPIIYPEGLTREDQVILGILVAVFNGVVYGVVIRRWRAGDLTTDREPAPFREAPRDRSSTNRSGSSR